MRLDISHVSDEVIVGIAVIAIGSCTDASRGEMSAAALVLLPTIRELFAQEIPDMPVIDIPEGATEVELAALFDREIWHRE